MKVEVTKNGIKLLNVMETISMPSLRETGS